MKIVLVNPPHNRFYGTGSSDIPPGLLRVGQSLWDNDHDVVVYNADAGKEQDFSDRYWFYESDDIFRRNHRSWWMLRKIIRPIVKARPDVVGFYLYSSGLPYVERMMTAIRKRLPKVKFLAGGPHLQQRGSNEVANMFDGACTGDGENAVIDMIGADKKAKYGYYDTNPDDYPLIQEELFPDGDFRPLKYLNVAKRGPRRSLYESTGHKPLKTEMMSPEATTREIAYRQCLGLKKFHFVGEYLLDDLDYIVGLLKHLPKGVRFTADARPDQIDRTKAEFLCKMNCDSIRLTIDFGTDKMLQLIKKGFSVAETTEAVSTLKRWGIGVEAYMKVGCPGVGRDEYVKSLEFFRRMEFDHVYIGYLIPHYESQLYRMMFKAITSNIMLIDALLTGRYFYHGWAQLWNIDDKLLEAIVSLNERKSAKEKQDAKEDGVPE